MPFIKDAVVKNELRIRGSGEAAGIPQNPLQSAPTPPQDLPAGGGLPQRGMFPANLVLASDRSDSSRTFRGAGARSATFPYQQTPNVTQQKTTIISQPSAATTALLLQTNGLNNPNQKILDLVAGPGVELSSDPTGAVTIAGTSFGDGLIHGDTIWEIDDAVFRLRDDFSNFSALGSATGIVSEMYWAFFGSANQQSQASPFLGGINLSAAGTSSTVSILAQGIQHLWVGTQSAAWSLLDYPSWKMVWTFKVDRFYDFTNVTTPTVFNWSQVSFYLGLGNYPAWGSANSSTSVRPPYFIGLRYDTDPTAPAISDTDFVFEAVANTTDSNARGTLNTQGTVVHTGIAATEGTNYRLEMTCTVAGEVTMELSNGSTSFSSTVTMPRFTVTTNNELMASNGIGIINPSIVHMPAGPGTKLAISGATGGAAIFNGTQIAVGGTTSNAWTNCLLGGSLTFGSYSSTIACYPALFPYCGFGTDSSASPVANSKAITLDFFAFVWNPGVGGGTGTPNATKPRYW